MAVPNHLPFLVGTLNIRGMKSTWKQQQLLRMVRLHNVDILAVRETKMSTDQDTECALRPFREDFEVCVTHAVRFSAGCSLFLRKGLGYTFVSISTDQEGRFISCDISYTLPYRNPWRPLRIAARLRKQRYMRAQ